MVFRTRLKQMEEVKREGDAREMAVQFKLTDAENAITSLHLSISHCQSIQDQLQSSLTTAKLSQQESEEKLQQLQPEMQKMMSRLEEAERMVVLIIFRLMLK